MAYIFAKKRIPPWPRLAVVIIVFLLIVGAVQSSFMRPLWKAVGLVGQAEPYTAISFSDPRSLPTQVTVKQTSLTVAFMISNATSATQGYDWMVSVAEPRVFQHVTTGEITVAAGKTAKVSQSVKIHCKPGKIKLTVNLAQPEEHIDALMNCTL